MSERLCQFFIRGRCLRDVCEFLHPADLPPATSKDPEDPPEVVAIPEEQGKSDFEGFVFWNCRSLKTN